ncbi:MAG: DUF2208 domain-containing protein [Pyrobaculum sp.]
MRRVLISVLSTIAFAAMLTFFPGDYFTVLLLYFAIFFAISIFMGARSLKRGLAAAREISKGRPILEIDEKEIMKLMEKDKELVNEFRKFSRGAFTPLLLLPLFILIAVTLFPTLPPVAKQALGPHVGEHLALFLSYTAIFGLFTAISLALFKPPVMPRIARSVKIYEGGVVIDKNLGLKTPIEVNEYKVNIERKYVEFKLNNQIFRIYYKDVKELDGILSKIVKPLKQ